MEFETHSFKDLLSNIVDNRGKTCPAEDEGIPLIATNCIKNDALFAVYEKVRFVSQDTYNSWFRGHPEPGDIIFVCKGSPGRVAWVQDPVPYVIAQDMVAIRADKTKVYPKYLFALLRAPQTKAKVENMHVGTMIPHFKKGDFANLFFDIPTDKSYQKYVGDLYYSLCEKIELNRQLNETLEQMAQALFKSWFVDFDPVIDNALEAGNTIPEELQERAERRKAQIAKPDHQPLPDDIRKLFPSEFEFTEEMGWVPEGWEVSSLGQHTDFLNGYAFKSKELTDSSDNTIPIFKMGHIKRGGGFNPGGTKSYLPRDLLTEKQAKCYAQKGDLLMSMTDMKSNMVILGCTALMPVDNKYLVNQRVGRIRKKTSSYLDYAYLYFYTNDKTVVDELRSRANSGVQVNLTTASIKETPLLVPSKDVHSVFDVQVKALLEKNFSNDENSSDLAKLRDILLPKLISGELKV